MDQKIFEGLVTIHANPQRLGKVLHIGSRLLVPWLHGLDARLALFRVRVPLQYLLLCLLQALPAQLLLGQVPCLLLSLAPYPLQILLPYLLRGPALYLLQNPARYPLLGLGLFLWKIAPLQAAKALGT